MLFLHGGNFKEGFGGGALYDGRYIANSSNTVLVSINYRLGALGFLAVQTSNGAVNGNYGVLDQIQALTWVQETIAAFGGDPNQVTLFGQSAGACSTAVHMTLPQSRAMFSRAILESEPFGIPLRTIAESYDLGTAFLKFAGCPASAPTSCLLGLSVQSVLAAQAQIFADLGVDGRLLEAFMPFTPSVNTALIPVTPFDALNKGDVTPLPLMVGNTAQEAYLFIYEAYGKAVNLAQYVVLLDLICGVKDVVPLLEEYPVPKGSKDLRQQLSQVATDEVFLCINRNMTRTITASTSSFAKPRGSVASAINSAAGWKTGVWYYIFDHPQSFYEIAWPNMPFCWNVSCHGAELPFVFHQGDPAFFNWTAAEAALSAQMTAYWTNFAHTGNPNQASRLSIQARADRVKHAHSPFELPALTNWPAYTPGSSQSIRFMTPQVTIDSFYNRQR